MVPFDVVLTNVQLTLILESKGLETEIPLCVDFSSSTY